MNTRYSINTRFLWCLLFYNCSNSINNEPLSKDTTQSTAINPPHTTDSSTTNKNTTSVIPPPPITAEEFLASRKAISESDKPLPTDKADIKTNPKFRPILETEGPAPAIRAEHSSDNPEDNSPVFTEVDQKPVFKGFSEFFDENFTPLDGFNLNNFTGTIKIGFIVNQFGNVKDVNILQSSGSAELDNEIIRTFLKSSGKWTPGKIKDKPVNTRMTLPIFIDLEE